MTVKAFNITFKDEAVQTVNLKAGTWTFHAFVNALTYSIGLKDSTGVWHNYDLSDQTGAGWYDVQETITTDFDAVEISLLNNVGTAQVLFPMFEKGSRKSVKRPHEKDIEEAAIIKSASWEIHTSSPVIYKDAPDLTTDGAHTPVTVTGRHWVGSVMTEEGFLTVTANDETEAANASPSPVTIAPLNSADKHTYTIRLYNDANKTELLDYETIPVVFKGAKGVSAIRLHINNPVDVLPADSAGNVLSFTGTGTSIHVFEGAVELDYDGIGTVNGKFKVTAVPSNITMGAITDSGNVCVVADATAMTADKASIVYTVTGKTMDGFDFTITGEQNFTKTRMGQDGEGILSVIDYYGLSTSASVLPSTWYTTVPSKAANEFLWSYERIVYTDTTYDETQARVIQGKDAKGISSISNAYGYSTDDVTPPSVWYTLSSLPAKQPGQVLWVREDIEYSDGSSNATIGYPVRDGEPGLPGEDGDGITSTTIEYAKDASGTIPPTTGWSTSLPSPTLGWYLWTRTTTTYRVAASTVAYSVSRYAEDGLSGDPGTGVDGLRTEYYLSTSSTTQTGGTWQTTVPVWVAGTYIWERIVTVMSDLTEVIGTPYLSRTWETINQLQADANKAKAVTDKFGTTQDGGLISTVMVLLRELNSIIETAGVSGIQDDGYLPAYWSGGTYAEALAFGKLMRAVDRGDNPIASATLNAKMSSIVMLHNGHAKVGELIVKSNGQIIVLDKATGKIKFVINSQDIPSVADLMSETTFGESKTNTSVSGITDTVTLQNTISVDKNNSTLSFAADISLTLRNYTKIADASMSVDLFKNGVLYLNLGSLSVVKLDEGTSPVIDSYSISKIISGVPIGTYSVKITVVASGDVRDYDGSISTSTLAWNFTQSGVRYFQLGLNGLMAFYSDNHFHYTETKGLDVRGATNMPGVLAAGSSTSGGTQTNVWGAKSNSAGVTTITSPAAGFKVPLSDLSHSNYVVQITPHTNTTFRVGTKTSTYFEIYGSGGFDYVVIGKNYE